MVIMCKNTVLHTQQHPTSSQVHHREALCVMPAHEKPIAPFYSTTKTKKTLLLTQTPIWPLLAAQW